MNNTSIDVLSDRDYAGGGEQRVAWQEIEIVQTLHAAHFSDSGYSRDVPFGCVDEGLLSVLYFLPGQAMCPHVHRDSDEYFTAVQGSAEMLIDDSLVDLPQGHTYLRRRGTLHALRNCSDSPLVVQSFQTPIPQQHATFWHTVEGWRFESGCRCCWCGQIDNGLCANCGAEFQS